VNKKEGVVLKESDCSSMPWEKYQKKMTAGSKSKEKKKGTPGPEGPIAGLKGSS